MKPFPAVLLFIYFVKGEKQLYQQHLQNCGNLHFLHQNITLSVKLCDSSKSEEIISDTIKGGHILSLIFSGASVKCATDTQAYHKI